MLMSRNWVSLVKMHNYVSFLCCFPFYDIQCPVLWKVENKNNIFDENAANINCLKTIVLNLSLVCDTLTILNGRVRKSIPLSLYHELYNILKFEEVWGWTTVEERKSYIGREMSKNIWEQITYKWRIWNN